jgi:hypothetical protein
LGKERRVARGHWTWSQGVNGQDQWRRYQREGDKSGEKKEPTCGLHLSGGSTCQWKRERGQIPLRVRLVGRVAGPDWTTPVQTSFLFFISSFLLIFSVFLNLL